MLFGNQRTNDLPVAKDRTSFARKAGTRRDASGPRSQAPRRPVPPWYGGTKASWLTGLEASLEWSRTVSCQAGKRQDFKADGILVRNSSLRRPWLIDPRCRPRYRSELKGDRLFPQIQVWRGTVHESQIGGFCGSCNRCFHRIGLGLRWKQRDSNRNRRLRRFRWGWGGSGRGIRMYGQRGGLRWNVENALPRRFLGSDHGLSGSGQGMP
jgi:hypothetical protein